MNGRGASDCTVSTRCGIAAVAHRPPAARTAPIPYRIRRHHTPHAAEPYLSRISAAPQPHLSRISAVSQPYLSRASAVPQLHLSCTSSCTSSCTADSGSAVHCGRRLLATSPRVCKVIPDRRSRARCILSPGLGSSFGGQRGAARRAGVLGGEPLAHTLLVEGVVAGR